MSPGALTPAERRDLTTASLFALIHQPMPPDPDLRFAVDLGLERCPIRIVQRPVAQLTKPA